MSKERLEEIKERYMEHEYDYALSAMDIDWLIEQAERVQELEEENERLCALNIATTHELNHVDKINKRYREALEFYANEENYKPFDGISLSSYQNKIDEDGGQTAHKALESEE